MTGNRSQLINFVSKFMGTVRFGNDHVAAITSYGDYQIGNIMISQYQKDHMCYACSLGKSKKHTHKPKSGYSIQEKLYLLRMDLCSPMKIESINGKKYILVIVNDYLWFTWSVIYEKIWNRVCESDTEGLPRSIEGNVTALKPQTLEEAINISQ
ncbi:hypothetical protein Tco_0851252, partial [Tanacetum coccineum]